MSAPVINQEHVDRLVSLLEALASEKLGQRALAAKAVEDFRVELGFEWRDLIVLTKEEPKAKSPEQYGIPGVPPTILERLTKLRETKGSDFSSWERRFVEDVIRQASEGRRISTAQGVKIGEIENASGYRAFSGGWGRR